MAVVLLFVLWLGYKRAPRIFGFGSHVVKTTTTYEFPNGENKPRIKTSETEDTQSARTVWEWLTVLTISAVIAIVALMFTARQAELQRDNQVKQANDDSLQAYLDQMSALLLEDDLRNVPEDSEVRMLARSRTLTILSRLDPRGRSQVLQFLLETELIQGRELETPIINPSDPNLSALKNLVINLSGANLSGVFVPADTNLSYVDLSSTDLSGANLSEANLSTADLTATNMHDANLSRATLAFSDLGLADLREANLSNVDLTQTKLNDADLTDADLTGAHLWQADLSDAKGVGETTLVEYARYVGETIMPKGHTARQLETSFIGEESPSGKIPPGFAGAKIPEGEYDSDEFVPGFHFEVEEGWQSTGLFEETDFIGLGVEVEIEDKGQYVSSQGEVSFTRPSHLLDASDRSEQEWILAPENPDEWVSWFEGHPKLDTTNPKSVSIGGASGRQVDVMLKSTVKSNVDLYASNFLTMAAFADRVERFIIVDVGDDTVVVNVSAPTDKSKEFFDKADKLLDYLEWKNM
jgi:hypothetical protein